MSNEMVSDNVLTQAPDFIKSESNLGQENMGSDLMIPRIEIVQDLSPCRKQSNPEYIPGAREGMLYNSLTRELYGQRVLLVPVYYQKEYLIWKTRMEGGGYKGSFPTLTLAAEALNKLPDADKYEIVDTSQRFCILTNGAKIEEIVVSMSRSKWKVAKKWNSLVRMAGGDSFSRVYSLAVISEKSPTGREYYNYSIEPVGYPSKRLYDKALELYNSMIKGGVVADHTFDDYQVTKTEY